MSFFKNIIVTIKCTCVMVQTAHSGTVCACFSSTAVFHIEPPNSRRSTLQYSRHVVCVCVKITWPEEGRAEIGSILPVYYNALYKPYKYHLPKSKHRRPCRELATTALYWSLERTDEMCIWRYSGVQDMLNCCKHVCSPSLLEVSIEFEENWGNPLPMTHVEEV